MPQAPYSVTEFTMQTRSQVKKTQKYPPVYVVPKAPIPVPKAARTRLYDIICGNEVVNAEGHRFTLPVNDYIVIGKVARRQKVTRAAIAKIARNIGGYFHITFEKADGSTRSMYAHVNGAVTKENTLRLVDLELPASEHRCCRVDRILTITRDGTHYYI